jgi:hypothetical protein
MNLPAASYGQSSTGSTVIDQGTFRTMGFLNNGGVIKVGEEGRFVQSSGPLSITLNDGKFINAGAVEVQAQSRFENTESGLYLQKSSGTTTVDGTFQNSGKVVNGGAIDINSGGTLVDRGRFDNAGTVTNRGVTEIAQGAHGDKFVNRGEFINGTSGRTTVDGKFINGGNVTNNTLVSMTIGETGQYVQRQTLSSESPSTGNLGNWKNEGRVRIADGLFWNLPLANYVQTSTGVTEVAGGTFRTSGFFNNDGLVLVKQGGRFEQGPGGLSFAINNGQVINKGVFSVASTAQFLGAGSYVQNGRAAQTIVDGSFGNNIALQKGLLTGNGTITGHVVNTGGVVRAGGAVAPGTLTLASYTQGAGGRLDFRIGGLLGGTQYDVLKVNGPVSLNGTINVSLINNFTPNVGDKFDILRGDRITLGQVNFSLPSLPAGETWLTGIVGNFFQLSVAQAQVSAPEPNRLLVMGLGVAWLVLWQWKWRAAGVKLS